MASSSSPTPLHPLSLLAQVSSRQVTGCLQVMTPTNTWLLYLEQGQLNYVSTVERAFERLDSHLRRLSLQVPALVSAVRVQVRLLFEQQAVPLADYQAICWLVEQQHLHPNQASTLVETLSKEVLEDFLDVREGSYEMFEGDSLGNAPRYCQLNLRSTVEECYARLKQRRNSMSHINGGYQRLGSNGVAAPSGSPTSTTLPSREKAPNGSTKPGSKAQYTIACIDDSPTVLQAINSFLDDKIFSVIMIDDPVKALMQVIRTKPDLILLDVTMPSLDGYELCSLLRRHPDFKSTPIIMVTSNTGLIDRAKAKLVRASGYLTKPFNQSDLLKFIFKYLN
ncbi:response regulator [Nodosilinea sp. E11]|uniref:response regulator n=1 Tax=Nodosilinea sp. E11 TaxID=3037479 RepID=UPI002934444F|nr:response regulator [Nodosilinea sp. E11]WOD37652.1 response regulator [Nodosilinea sp. E11]